MVAQLSKMATAVFLLAWASILAQQPWPPSQPGIDERSVDLTDAKTLPGLGSAQILGYPMHCSSEGDVFLEIYALVDDRTQPNFPDLYRVSPNGEVKRIARPTPTGIKVFDTGSFYAAGGVLVSLIRASDPDVTGAAGGSSGKNFLLAVSDKDGDHPSLIKLGLGFDPLKVAAFSSGTLVALGIDRSKNLPVLALLRSDGRLWRFLDLNLAAGERGVGAGPSQAGEQRKAKALPTSLSAAQFAPWGSDILMALPGINSAVYHIRESGVVEEVDVKLIPGTHLESILGVDGTDTWVIRAESAESTKKMGASNIVENPEQSLYEVDPHSGVLRRRLDVHGPRPGEVACAVGERLTAIYVGDPNQPEATDKLVYASASR